jgi:hypothetical protein
MQKRYVTLTTRFASTDSRVANAAIKRWTAMKAAPGEKATSFITRLREQEENLRQKGKTFSDGELVGRLLEGLAENKTYQMNVAALETVRDLKFADAILQLQTKDEADAAAGEEPETASMAHGTIGAATANTETTQIICQICKKKGHSATHCRFREKKTNSGNQGGFKNTNNKGGGNNGKQKNLKDVKCYNCQKMGHYARDCRSKKRTQENGKNDSKTDEPNNKKQKTNGNGSWDNDEFSGMFQEDNNKK